METTTATRTKTTHVIAEDAPLGVQLWPTLSADYADNFTLDMVETHRTVNGTMVTWTYRNGTTRVFHAGDQVVVSF
jgi:hypothetical protein